MASIAHYVLVTGTGIDLRYSHWGAQSLLRDVFWGPEHTLAFLSGQTPTDRWRSEVWCEAVVCVDPARRTLVLSGRMDVLPERRVYLAALAATWPGWTLRWAYRGVLDVVQYLALDPALVRDPGDGGDPLPPVWDLAEDDPNTDRPNTVVSIRSAAGSLALHALDPIGLLPDLLDAGPEQLTGTAGHPHAELAPVEFPMSGLHLDFGRRQLGYWTADSIDEQPEHPVGAQRWPGWEITCWYDRYEEQLTRTGGALRLPVGAPGAAGAAVLEFLTSTHFHHPSATGLEQRLGPGALVNPHVDSHGRVDPPARTRADALALARTVLDRMAVPDRSP